MLAVVERFFLLVVVLAGLVWVIKYHFDKADRQITAKFVWQAIVSVVIALCITLPFFLLNNISGL